jgi:hypothetical protein
MKRVEAWKRRFIVERRRAAAIPNAIQQRASRVN